MPDPVYHSDDDMDRLYRAFREAGVSGSLEITQGSGYIKARVYVFGSPGDVLDEMRRMVGEGVENDGK